MTQTEERVYTDAELASIARHGGRLITKDIADALSDIPSMRTWTDTRRQFAGEGTHVREGTDPSDAAMYGWSGRTSETPAEALAWAWEHKGGGTRKQLANWAAEKAYATKYTSFSNPGNPAVQAMILQDAEAMVGWPMYRIALMHPMVIAEIGLGWTWAEALGIDEGPAFYQDGATE